MKTLYRVAAAMLVAIMLTDSTLLALDSKDAAYFGGTITVFGNPKDAVEGKLDTSDEKTLLFAAYGKEFAGKTFSISYAKISDLEYGQKAGEGKLSIEELSGGTFSISNGGVFGSMLSTPIINPPQSAILGVHATKDRAVVENGQVVVRPINYLAMSYDHRIIDGREAVLGLVAMKEALEDPARLLFDI